MYTSVQGGRGAGGNSEKRSTVTSPGARRDLSRTRHPQGSSTMAAGLDDDGAAKSDPAKSCGGGGGGVSPTLQTSRGRPDVVMPRGRLYNNNKYSLFDGGGTTRVSQSLWRYDIILAAAVEKNNIIIITSRSTTTATTTIDK